MTKNKILAVACTLLILAGGLYYFAKEEPLPPPPPPEVKQSSAEITFAGSSIVEQQNGKKLWELTSETSQVDPNTNQVKMNNFKGILYRENGGRIDLVAQQAVLDTKTRDIFLDGNIKAVSSDGAVFTAPKARWTAKEQHFYGSGGIVLTRDDTVITGDAIDSDANMEKVTVQGNAHAVKGGTPQ
ncbi:MAG: LPS export ABC transporter periplasmic protein LptC [Negativicutes bacterium]|nr:LPS export ABC transporter periplasmic protein LptC [Negativicutes bacterium]